MPHMLGPKFHVSLATLVRLLLAMTMEIWDRECAPFRPISPVFAIVGNLGNIISPWGKGPSREEVEILVADDQGSIPPDEPFLATRHGGFCPFWHPDPT